MNVFRRLIIITTVTLFFQSLSADQVKDKFKKTSDFYAKSETKIYYFDEHDLEGGIPEADYATFVDLGDGFAKDKNKVYYADYDLLDVENADPESFYHFPGTDYARDKNHAYFRSRTIPGADLNSFEGLGVNYAKDNNHGYLWDEIIKGALGKIFQVFAKNSHYARDDKHVFYEGKMVNGADIKTFEELNIFYGKDKDHVYSGITKTKIDSKTVRCSKSGLYIMDKYGVYWSEFTNENPKKIKGADPESFVEISFGFDGLFGKDKNHVYRDSEVIKGADPETFQKLKYPYYRDKTHVFKFQDVLTDVDPETFDPNTFDLDEYCKTRKHPDCN